MGLFKSVKKGIKRVTSGDTAKNPIGQVGKMTGGTVNATFGVAGGIVGNTGALGRQTLTEAGSILSTVQQNPALAGALGTMFPAIGGILGSGAGGGSAPVVMPTDSPASTALPWWVWIVAAVAGLVGLVLILKRKAS